MAKKKFRKLRKEPSERAPPPQGRPPVAGEMTPMQERFVEVYLISNNAAEAARQAGYSHDIARSLGQRLTDPKYYPHVVAAVEEGRRRLADLAEIEAVHVRRETMLLATSNIKRVANTRNNVLNINSLEELSDADAACIQSIKHGKYGIEVKLHSKDNALRLLSQQLGILAPEKHEHSGPGGKPIELKVMSDEQLDAEIQRELARIQGTPVPPATGKEAS